MTTAFVLGNGISRRGLDLSQLHQYGKIYGCNALYREFVPDVLVATDRPIATAIQESGYALKNQFYTRRPIDGFGAHKVSKPYFGYSSGPIAVAVAAEHGNKTVYLIGFDMGPDDNNQFNNIYAGTEFYKPPNALPTFTGNWIKQIIHITSDFPDTMFVRVHGPTTAQVAQFDTVLNLKQLDLSAFLNQLNG
jgi:hypothetical protein